MNRDINKLLINKILFKSKNKKKIIRSSILIMLIVSLLIISVIFINSMSIGISKKFSLLVNGDIEVYTAENFSDKYDFIYSSDIVSYNNTLIYGKEDTQLTNIKAVEDSYFNDKRLEALNIDLIDNPTSLISLIISNEIAQNLDLEIGDKAAIIFSNNDEKIRPKLAYIKGIYNSGYKEIDQSLCYMSFEDLNKIYKENINTHQEIILKDNYSIENSLLELRLDDYFARAWYEAQPSVYNNLLVSTQSLLYVFIVIALLTGYFISSVASDIITKDHKNIAINKLLGLQNKQIRYNYFIAIELFTIISTLLGIVFGIFSSQLFLSLISSLSNNNIPALSWYLLDFDIIIPVKEIFIISASLILISMISVYSSLRRIRKIEVLDLLNHE